MRNPKTLIGKYVEVVWRDPCRASWRSLLPNKADVPRGEHALPLWRERGVVDDVTDNVLRIVHSECTESGAGQDTMPEYIFTLVPADRIEAITVLVAQPAEETPVVT
jgi:hypothetical protein